MGLREFLGDSGDLAALIANLIRVGEVTSINPSTFTARVRFVDREDTESYNMQVLSQGSLRDKFFHMPDIGENVVCLFLPSGVEAGFIIGAYYPSGVARPAASEDISIAVFADGTRIQYDRASNELLVDLSSSEGAVNIICGEATIKAKSVTLDAPSAICTGDLDVAGSLSVSGDNLTHKGKNVGHDHTHSGVQPGGGSTGEPV